MEIQTAIRVSHKNLQGIIKPVFFCDVGSKHPTVPSECRVSAWLLAGESSPAVLLPAWGWGSGEGSPRRPGPPSRVRPHLPSQVEQAERRRNVSREDERIWGLIWRCRHTDACLFNNGINTRGCFLACSREDGRPQAYPGGWGRRPWHRGPGVPLRPPGPRPISASVC